MSFKQSETEPDAKLALLLQTRCLDLVCVSSDCFIVLPHVQLTFSEPPALGAATSSEFEVEPVQGRKVSKVVKTTVVRGERTEKQTGDRSLAADLPSAREDFEKVSVPSSLLPARGHRSPSQVFQRVFSLSRLSSLAPPRSSPL